MSTECPLTSTVPLADAVPPLRWFPTSIEARPVPALSRTISDPVLPANDRVPVDLCVPMLIALALMVLVLPPSLRLLFPPALELEPAPMFTVVAVMMLAPGERIMFPLERFPLLLACRPPRFSSEPVKLKLDAPDRSSVEVI